MISDKILYLSMKFFIDNTFKNLNLIEWILFKIFKIILNFEKRNLKIEIHSTSYVS